jgi:SPP1 family predicted phage head-tail adaptor
MTGAGDLDRRITIERFTSTRNEFNEPVQAWATLVTVWAQRKDSSDLTKVEYLGADQVSAFHMSRFIIRSSSVTKTVTPVDRINYDGHIWNIKGAKETAEGRNRFIEITAVRASNG